MPKSLAWNMSAAGEEGSWASKDGLNESQFRFPMTSPERSEWRAGWEQAERHKEREDEKYR